MLILPINVTDKGSVRLPFNIMRLRFNIVILPFNITDRERVRVWFFLIPRQWLNMHHSYKHNRKIDDREQNGGKVDTLNKQIFGRVKYINH